MELRDTQLVASGMQCCVWAANTYEKLQDVSVDPACSITAFEFPHDLAAAVGTFRGSIRLLAWKGAANSIFSGPRTWNIPLTIIVL